MTKQRKKLSEIIPKWAQNFVTIVAAITAALGVVTGMVSAIQEKVTADLKGDLEQLSQDVASIKLDTTRMQLLTLMNEDPDNVTDILKVAKYYFKDLNGDWYMSRLFTEWANSHNIDVSDMVKITEK